LLLCDGSWGVFCLCICPCVWRRKKRSICVGSGRKN
jgi:hypothetical protein